MANDLEYLLEQQREKSKILVKTKYQDEQKGIQTADKNASMYDFITMVSKLVSLTMKDLNVEFVSEEGKKLKLEPEELMDAPFISFKLINRTPKDELKPRMRQNIREEIIDKDEERIGEIYGQKFKCLVQFNIFSSVYETAEQVMERFEELIFTYTGFLKKNGVAEVIFNQQITDSSYDFFRQTLSVRNLQYYIEIEKLTVLFKEKIKEIETYLQS